VKLLRADTGKASESAAAITAAHGLGSLGEVVHHKLATSNTDRLELVAAGLVGAVTTISKTLSHFDES